jgi:hypothetical protein
MPRPLILLFLVTFNPLGILQAQSARPLLHLRAFMFGGEARTLYLQDQGAITSLRASPVQPSTSVQIQGREVLKLYDQAGPNPDGSAPEPVASLSLPPNGSHFLLLVLNEGDETKFGLMEDDLHRADARDWMFLNMTDSSIAFQIGEETDPIIIKPKSRFTHRVPPVAAGNLPVRAAARFQGEVELFYSTFWPMRPDRRTLILFSQEGQRIRLRRIIERIPSDSSRP